VPLAMAPLSPSSPKRVTGELIRFTGVALDAPDGMPLVSRPRLVAGRQGSFGRVCMCVCVCVCAVGGGEGVVVMQLGHVHVGRARAMQAHLLTERQHRSRWSSLLHRVSRFNKESVPGC
jgi:hypothetical protein